jgi:GNAT superfamily N-acetyltransferase
MSYDPKESRDKQGKWTVGVVTVAAAGVPGRKGRVSGEIEDSRGDQYTVFHQSEEKDNGFHKHEFQAFEKDKFNLADAQRGVTTGQVNVTTLHYHGDRVMDTQTEDGFQRRGIASAMYEHIEQVTGVKLKSQWAQTEAGKALWASRERKGKG